MGGQAGARHGDTPPNSANKTRCGWRSGSALPRLPRRPAAVPRDCSGPVGTRGAVPKRKGHRTSGAGSRGSVQHVGERSAMFVASLEAFGRHPAFPCRPFSGHGGVPAGSAVAVDLPGDRRRGPTHRAAMQRQDAPAARPRGICSRSASDSCRADRLGAAGRTPPTLRIMT